MRLKFLKYLLAVFIALSTAYQARAQNEYQNIVFSIDSLTEFGRYKSALAGVQKLDQMARQQHNTPYIIRSAIYRMQLLQYLEDDALPNIIAHLKADIQQTAFPAKPVLQSLLGTLYWQYYKLNRSRFGGRIRHDKPEADIARWDLPTIINKADSLFSQPLQNSKALQKTPVGELNGVLNGDAATRYLRPTLYDLLAHRALKFYFDREIELPFFNQPTSLNNARYYQGAEAFVRTTIATKDTTDRVYHGLRLLQQATAFHLQNGNVEAVADLDLMRLQYLRSHQNTRQQKQLYLSGLQQFVKAYHHRPIVADGWVLLGKFYEQQDSLAKALTFYNEAIRLFPQSLGGLNAAKLKHEILRQNIGVTVESVYSAGKPMLALLKYRNLESTNLTVFELTTAQLAWLEDKGAFNAYRNLPGATLKYVQKVRRLEQATYKLPSPHDYHPHSAEVKLSALAPGTYAMLVDGPLNQPQQSKLVKLQVTNLAYVTRRNPNGMCEVRVMDRQSGRPLMGAAVTIYEEVFTLKRQFKKVKINAGFTDVNGRYLFKKADQDVIIDLNYQQDHLSSAERSIEGRLAQTLTDDGPTKHSVIFTDRQLYRPGQTVYFKVLYLQKQAGVTQIIPNQSVEVKLNNNSGKTVNRVTLTTNDFGSASGSFVLPVGMVNGSFFISAGNGYTTIKVEEYKRPNFEVKLLPVTQSYGLGDSVIVKGQVKTFSGYGIANARVACNVKVSVEDRRAGQIDGLFIPDGLEQTAANDTLTTDSAGEFEIRFKAIELEIAPTAYCFYKINADVTDGAGETHSANLQVKVANQPLVLDVAVPKVITVNNGRTLNISLKNLNGQPIDGEARVTIYKLQSPNHAFKKRLWDAPDQHIISREDFMKSFGDDAYQNEDEMATWPITDTVAARNVSFNKTQPQQIYLDDLFKQVSGSYSIVVKAHSSGGDTVSYTQQFVFANQPGKIQRLDDWLIPLKTTVKLGGAAEFLVGAGDNVSLLMEKYDGAKLLSSEWITLSGGAQQKIKVDLPARIARCSAQFLMISNNRVYQSYQNIMVRDMAEQLPVKLVTFRNKLQPGQKEQWKLQVGDSTKTAAAEMVATLYDASLDDLWSPQHWTIDDDHNDNWSGSYFKWDTDDFVNPENYEGYEERDSEIEGRNYEELDLFDYDYYGGENYTYQSRRRTGGNVSDGKLNTLYYKNALAIKNGFDAVGRVVSLKHGEAIQGIRIGIPGTAIFTRSNSAGYFKIKVSVNGRIVLSGLEYVSRAVTFKRGQKQIIGLRDAVPYTEELKIADPGVKSIEGDPTQTVRINEPVGNIAYDESPVINQKSMGYRYISKVRFPPPLLKADEQIREKDSVENNGRQSSDIIRRNFNETAFFYPQLHTDEHGQILIDFTMPQALTRWHFKAFAHTQKLATALIEQQAVTQKQLMADINMPRFLREGDTLTVAARLANLSVQALSGKVQLKFFSAVNMQPIAMMVDGSNDEQAFTLKPNANQAAYFKLMVPANVEAITYRLVATTAQFSDGEENVVPVLPNRVLVTETMPMMVRAGQSQTFTFDKLLHPGSATLQSKSLTLEYTANPAWYAVQAMPYLMEFPYECSEQTFSRYFANSMSAAIIDRHPQIKQVFERWKTADSKTLLSALEQNPELKNILLEETPWLQDAENESEQKKRIALLFDLEKLNREQNQTLDQLQKKQLPGGGFAWFGGNLADRFITQHIIAGIGQLNQAKIAPGNNTLKNITNNALTYLDAELLSDDELRKKTKGNEAVALSALEIHGWYARSYFAGTFLSTALKKAQQQYLNLAAQQFTTWNIYEQALVAFTMQRAGRSAAVKSIINSLKETARQSNELGMYWAGNRAGGYWNESPVETQAMLIELFTETGQSAKDIQEMKIWLLRNKQAKHWATTKATAAACYALLMKEEDLSASVTKSDIKLNGRPLTELKPGVKTESGTGYTKASWSGAEVEPGLGNVTITNPSQAVGWGALYWQYTEIPEKVKASSNELALERKYFIQKQDKSGKPVLVAIDSRHQPQTGDLLKVVVYLKATRNFEYVQLKDMRPSGTEPVDVLSAYRYKDGLSYYQVTKDVATNFFISNLPQGNYVFDYELRVAQAGNFATGISTVQCMYAPEFAAHSNGGRVHTK